jgi:flagellin
MSFRINTNIAAQGALRNVNKSTDDLNRSINRLSTGLRINNASDDPAGLIASEGFRSQIASMDQAVRNNQDAVNYAKTAEGALSEVNSLLNDARTLAVASANSGVLTSSQVQANQDQLNSIVSSITRISSQTTFGSKKLLDGTSGVTSAVTNATKIGAMSIGGQVGGAAVSANAVVTVSAVTAGTRAAYSSTGTLTSGTLATGSFSLNGTTFSFQAGTTSADVVNAVNAASANTGVSAVVNGSAIDFKSTKFGSAAKIDFVDANGVLSTTAGTTSSTAGTDATATVSVGSATGVAFTGGKNGNDGLTLTDADGNTITLTAAGNATTSTPAAVGQVVVGSAKFQIGANSGQSATLSLGNFAATQLGAGVVSGKTLANLDLSTAAGSADAMSVIDKAISEVSSARGKIGNFQRNTLESNMRSLSVARENLAASESAIRDTDVAEEMSNYTKAQILQQAGLSVLGQANSAPQSVLSLLR